MKKHFLILILVTFLLAACSANSGVDSVNEQTENNSNQTAPKENIKEKLFDDGVDEKALKETIAAFPKNIPKRVITTSVPITEMLYLLDITPVGVPTSTNPIPEAFEDIEQIGSPMQPDLEIITSLHPNLVLGAKSLESSLEKNLVGIEMDRAYLQTDSYQDLKHSFKALGTYFNKTKKMNKVMENMVKKEVELASKADEKELPSVLLIIGTADSFMVMNDRSYLGSLIETLGAENIATTVLNSKETYSPINMEAVVEADPDVIFVLASGDHGASEEMLQKEVENNDIWTKLSAYKNDRVHILDYEVFGITSILNVEDAMTQLAKYFYQ